MSNKKKIEDILNLYPVGIDQDMEALKTNQMIYAFAHDVLHWLVNSEPGFQMFFGDLAGAMLADDHDVPDTSLVMRHLEMTHKALEMMTNILEQMNPGDLP
jgi:hypothetical protein